MIKAEIITIGDEILIGQIVDTNSAWLGDQFSKAGIPIASITSIGDDREQIRHAILDAMKRSQAVVITGGLGPTKDDITKHTLAEIFDMPLVRDQATYEHIRGMLTTRGVDFNDSNRGQADVPQGARVLKNNNGTAPGMMFEKERSLLFSLPGVPFEMKALVEEQVLPIIKEHFDLHSVVHRTAMTFGMAESVLSETIAPWEDALPSYLKLAYLPNPRAIRLRLSAYDVDRDSATKEIEAQFEKLQKIIKPFFLGYEPTTVESALAEILTQRGQTLSVAESCTGGTVAARITSLAGASLYFRGGVVSYDNDIKADIIGVDPEDIERYGAVSQQVVEQMACGVRKLIGTDFSIATSGIAGPDGGTPDKPVGTVWMAISWEGGVYSRKMLFGKLRVENILRASSHALNILRLHLLGYNESLQNTGML